MRAPGYEYTRDETGDGDGDDDNDGSGSVMFVVLFIAAVFVVVVGVNGCAPCIPIDKLRCPSYFCLDIL